MVIDDWKLLIKNVVLLIDYIDSSSFFIFVLAVIMVAVFVIKSVGACLQKVALLFVLCTFKEVSSSS